MEQLFKKLDLIKKKFEDLEKKVKCETQEGKTEKTLSSIDQLDSLIKEAYQIERGFLHPASLPLSVIIFDEIKEAKKALGLPIHSII